MHFPIILRHLGYSVDTKAELYKKYWPADVHVIGKDILRFHTIYWPIILMALGEPLPKQVFGHPWLLSGTDKMSKSIGNVIYADDLVKEFGVDAIRFYLLSEMPYAQDGTITYKNIINKYNSELVNTLGNLVNRTVAMIKKYFNGEVFVEGQEEDIDKDLINTIDESTKIFIEKMNEYKTAEAINAIWDVIRKSNKYIDETMPWILAKDEGKQQRLKKVLYNLIESIRITSVMLQSIMPETAERIEKQIGVESKDLALDISLKFGGIKENMLVNEAQILFERLDVEEKMNQILNNNTQTASNQQEETKLITIDDVEKVKLKTAKVMSAEKIENSDKLLKILINVGAEQRTIVSGLAKYYTCDELIDKNIVLVSNLQPVKLRGVESNGMLLAAGEDPCVKLVTIDGDIPPGTCVC